MTNDKLRIHVISGDGMRRNRHGADGPKDRTQLLKYASFYLVAAVILLVTNQAAKNTIGSANQSTVAIESPCRTICCSQLGAGQSGQQSNRERKVHYSLPAYESG